MHCIVSIDGRTPSTSVLFHARTKHFGLFVVHFNLFFSFFSVDFTRVLIEAILLSELETLSCLPPPPLLLFFFQYFDKKGGEKGIQYIYFLIQWKLLPKLPKLPTLLCRIPFPHLQAFHVVCFCFCFYHFPLPVFYLILPFFILPCFSLFRQKRFINSHYFSCMSLLVPTTVRDTLFFSSVNV